uniref:Uncharacterized protein n=2 Tax=Lygus hesperus TaxID=30085 RepID=A0A146KQN8_LYGHE
MCGGMGDDTPTPGAEDQFVGFARPPVHKTDLDAVLQLLELWDKAASDFLRVCRDMRLGPGARQRSGSLETSGGGLRIEVLEGQETARLDLAEKQNEDLVKEICQIATAMQAIPIPIWQYHDSNSRYFRLIRDWESSKQQLEACLTSDDQRHYSLHEYCLEHH